MALNIIRILFSVLISCVVLTVALKALKIIVINDKKRKAINDILTDVKSTIEVSKDVTEFEDKIVEKAINKIIKLQKQQNKINRNREE